MAFLPLVQSVLGAAEWDGETQVCSLDYDARFVRRKTLVTDSGTRFLVDLAETTSLSDGDILPLSNETCVKIKAAPEPVLRVTGANLPQLSWHIGNRHTPCQIMPDALIIRDDPVIGHMLEHLGAALVKQMQPFTPEGGAYGLGRTHSHEHGKTAHDH
ncbi:MAG: urease accessory protein UreE [Yoonia sp.]|nr:urease accessory protein UreE [Yoonia sp.]MDG1863818.1 urease accessory protein UreE [Yoonia sp.]